MHDDDFDFDEEPIQEEIIHNINKEPLEYQILLNIIKDEKFRNKCFSKLLPEYFSDTEYCNLFKHFNEFCTTYDSVPNPDSFKSYITTKNCVRGEDVSTLYVKLLNDKTIVNDLWLYDETESWAMQRSVLEAITKCYGALENNFKEIPATMIPSIMENALNVSFKEEEVAHSFDKKRIDQILDDLASDVDKIPFKLDIMNLATDGGVSKQTLSVTAMITGGGKSLMMLDFARSYVEQGYNTLYVSYELSTKEIKMRYFSNLCQKNKKQLLSDLRKDSQSTKEYIHSVKRTKEKGYFGVIKLTEGVDTAQSIERYVKDLKLNHGITIDVIVADHLKNMGSSTAHKNSQEHTRLGKIAIELRALACKTNTAIWTGMQLTRDANDKEDMTMAHIAESIAVIHTVDFLITSKFKEDISGYRCSVLKNRLNSDFYKAFFIGSVMGQYRLDNMSQDIDTFEEKDRDDDLSLSSNKVKEKTKLKLNF